MSYTPDEANDRMHELKKKQVAKLLYVAYCRFRNALTGRTNVHNETIAARYGINIAQLSTSKVQLLDAGWVARDPEELKWGVIPLVGAQEFQARRAWAFQRMSEEDRWAFINSKVKIWNYETSDLEIPNFQTLTRKKLQPSDLEFPSLTTSDLEIPNVSTMSDLEIPNLAEVSPYSINHTNTRTTAAAAASDLEIPNLTVSTPGPPSEVCDRAYLESVIAARRYPPELDEADVRRVFNDCLFDSSDSRQTPTKKLFRGYLRAEAEAKLRRGQLMLPVEGKPLAQSSFNAPAQSRGEAADVVAPGNVRYPLEPDPSCQLCAGAEGHRTPQGLYCVCRICQLCFGVGRQISKGQGARRCPHLTGEIGAREARTG